MREKFKELGLNKGGLTVDGFLKSIQQEREQDPDFLEPMGPKSEAQLYMMTSGASYPSATMTAGLTGSYLFTYLHVKWREISLTALRTRFGRPLQRLCKMRL